MNPGPTLSVIIVNYNTAGDLERCLRSIFDSKQECSYDVWVVDNASSDESANMVRKQFPTVTLLTNESNQGFSKANNRALRRAKGDFLLLLNPDTVVPDSAFDIVLNFLRATPDAGMATAKLVLADGSLDLACRRSFPSLFDGFCRATGLSNRFPDSRVLSRYNLRYLPEDQVAQVGAVNGAFMMVRRAAFEEVGLLEEDYFMYQEDFDWCFRFGEKGWKIFYVPDATVVHLKGQSSRRNSEEMIGHFFDSMEVFCEKIYRARYGPVRFAALLWGIRAWKRLTLFKNRLRPEHKKRVQP